MLRFISILLLWMLIASVDFAARNPFKSTINLSYIEADCAAQTDVWDRFRFSQFI